MSRKRKNDLKEKMKELEAKDAVVGYLWKMPGKLAKLVALSLAKSKMTRWEAERLLMIQRGDPRPVYQSSRDEALWLDARLAKTTRGGVSTTYEERRAASMLADLPPDIAAWVAFKVARWAVVHFRGRDLVEESGLSGRECVSEILPKTIEHNGRDGIEPHSDKGGTF
jgi:hypothetical protein